MKVLNLYAGIGGNRKLWKDVDVTAVEIDEETAKVYQDYFPDDNVIIGDAHQYLIDNFDEFNFIWSSPPCQTHSSFRQNICVRYRGTEPKYPDLKLWQEVIFLKHNHSGKWVIENVDPYYDPLLNPEKVGRHLFWSNFKIGKMDMAHENLREIQIPGLQELYGFDLDGYKISNKRQRLRNCVHPEIGKYILERAKGIYRKSNTKQMSLI